MYLVQYLSSYFYNPVSVFVPREIQAPEDLPVQEIGRFAFQEFHKLETGSSKFFVNCRRKEKPYSDFDYKLHMFITKKKNESEVAVYATPPKHSSHYITRQGASKIFSKAFRLTFNINDKEPSCSLSSLAEAARLKNKINNDTSENKKWLDLVNREASTLGLFQDVSSICRLLDKTKTYEGRHRGCAVNKSAMYQSYHPEELFECLRRDPGKLRNNPLIFAKIGADLLWALVNIHEKQHVHGDVKLENILIDEKGHAFLADFDLCRKKEDTWGMGGTSHYFPPEKLNQLYLFKTLPEDLRNLHKYDEDFQCSFPSDIWASGFVLLAVYSQFPIWKNLLEIIQTNYAWQKHLTEGVVSIIPQSIESVIDAQTRLIEKMNQYVDNFQHPFEIEKDTKKEFLKLVDSILQSFLNLKNDQPVLKTASRLPSRIDEINNNLKCLVEKIWKKIDTKPLRSQDPYLRLIAKLLKSDPTERLTARQAYEELKALIQKDQNIVEPFRFPDEKSTRFAGPSE